MSGILDVWHPVLSGLIGGLIATTLAAIPQRARADRHGWKVIIPGTAHWVGLVLGGLLSTFLTIMAVRHPMGAEDFHRDPRNALAFYCVFAGFWAATVFMAFQIRRIRQANVEWLGGQIAFNQPNGTPRFCLMTHVAELRPTAMGQVHVIFFDGSILKLDEHAKGASELCQAIIDANEGDDDETS